MTGIPFHTRALGVRHVVAPHVCGRRAKAQQDGECGCQQYFVFHGASSFFYLGAMKAYHKAVLPAKSMYSFVADW